MHMYVHVTYRVSLYFKYLSPYGDDSIVVSHSKVLAIIRPRTATSLGHYLTLGHRLLLWRPQPWEKIHLHVHFPMCCENPLGEVQSTV